MPVLLIAAESLGGQAILDRPASLRLPVTPYPHGMDRIHQCPTPDSDPMPFSETPCRSLHRDRSMGSPLGGELSIQLGTLSAMLDSAQTKLVASWRRHVAPASANEHFYAFPLIFVSQARAVCGIGRSNSEVIPAKLYLELESRQSEARRHEPIRASDQRFSSREPRFAAQITSMALGGYTAIKFDAAHIERVFCASPLPRMDDLLGVGGLSAVALPAISNESEAGFHGQPAACYRQGRRMTHDHHLARSNDGNRREIPDRRADQCRAPFKLHLSACNYPPESS